mgnify:CR=1 FL=1
MKLYSIRLMALVASTAMVVGCESATPHPEEFPPLESSTVARTLEVQAARGARQDAMLHEIHFDGNRLNSLGQDKLDLMLKDNDTELPLVVYLNVPGDAKSKRESAEKYLQEAGLRTEQFKFETGINPKATAPSAKAIADLPRTNSGSTPEAQTTDAATDPSAGMSPR